MKKVIHINQHIIKRNRINKTEDPCITIKTYKDNFYAKSVTIEGASKVIYSPCNPLKCGAHCYIETEAIVTFVNDSGEEVSI